MSKRMQKAAELELVAELTGISLCYASCAAMLVYIAMQMATKIA